MNNLKGLEYRQEYEAGKVSMWVKDKFNWFEFIGWFGVMCLFLVTLFLTIK